jgi:MiaB-like tRNA modifying enzyme
LRFFVDAYGCTMNIGEGREIGERLREAGHQPARSADEAETVVLVTCDVIEHTERRMRKLIDEHLGAGKKLLVAGCMAAVQEKRMKAEGLEVLLFDDYGRVAERLPAPEPLSPAGDLSSLGGCAPPPEPRPASGEFILPINQGCLGKCTYCITLHARGRLRSFDPDEIVRKAEDAVRRGHKEIYLTSQDTAVFGWDIQHDLPWIVERVARIDGDFRIRVGMMNPGFAFRIKERILRMHESPKVYRFLHLPVQSGSPRVLEAMKRDHGVEEYESLVRSFRERHEDDATDGDTMVSTDIIVGFPGETEEEFEMTLDLLRRTRPDVVNVTRFSPRFGTPAARMGRRPHGRAAKSRSRRASALRFEIARERNERLVGRRFECVVSERGKDGFVCRTDAFRPVVVRDESLAIGDRIFAEATEARNVYLLGRPR